MLNASIIDAHALVLFEPPIFEQDSATTVHPDKILATFVLRSPEIFWTFKMFQGSGVVYDLERVRYGIRNTRLNSCMYLLSFLMPARPVARRLYSLSTKRMIYFEGVWYLSHCWAFNPSLSSTIFNPHHPQHRPYPQFSSPS